MPRLSRLLVFLLLAPLVHAALPTSKFTEKERAQGYRDDAVIAKPRAGARIVLEDFEAREGMRVQRRFSELGNLRVLKLPAGASADLAMKRLRESGHYEYVEPDRILKARRVPSDSYLSDQWALRNTGQSGGTSGADIDAIAAWDTFTDASSVTVAIVDSGVYLNHEDLKSNLWKNSSGRYGISAIDGDGRTSDTNPNDSENGHGTHIAGIIGAVGNNGRGVAGVAWKTKLMALRFLSGAEGEGSTSDSIACINYAINNGAKVINASYGSETYSKAEYEVIKRARDKGVIVVVAAGNDANNNDLIPDYPAGYPLDNIVAVAASDRKDRLASFSNYGAGLVELAAPGDEIISTFNGSSSDYATLSGTSMAAPHVTGALALLRARYPKDTYRQSINRLLRSVDRLSAFSGKVQTGGRLNLATAVKQTSNKPFNDSFSRRAKLVGENIRVRASNKGATRQSGEPSSSHNATLWWSWKAPATTQVEFTTEGSSYNTHLAVYTGSSLSKLKLIGSNNNASSSTKTSRLVLKVKKGTTYQISVGSRSSSTGYTALRIGSVPPNNTFSKAKALSKNSQIRVAGTTRNATRQSGEPLAVSGSSGHSVWYKWTAPSTKRYSLAAFATQIDTVAAVYTGSKVSSLKKIASNDNNQDSGNTDTLVSFKATKGKKYYFQVDDYKQTGNDGAEFILTLTDSLWEFPTFDEVTSSPAVGSDGTVYFGSLDGYVYAVNSSGSLKWQYPKSNQDGVEGGFDMAAPAIGKDGTIYIGGVDNYLYALSGSSGSRRWRYKASSPISSTPAIGTDDTIYFRDDTTLYALSSSVAFEKWRYTLGGSGTYSSPAIGTDGTIYVGANGHLHAINPTTGKRKWRLSTDDDVYTSPSIATDGTVYIATLKGTVYAVKDNGSSATTKWKWKNSSRSSITSSIAIAPDGTLYFAAYDSYLYALNGSTGKQKWRYKLGDEVRASSPAIAANGYVYVGCYDGRVYAIKPDGTKSRTFPTALQIRSSPVIAGKRLYFGSADAKLHAFTLSAGPATKGWPMLQGGPTRNGRRE